MDGKATAHTETKMPDTTASQFQAYYLQRTTVELAEDLDTLRKADDFKMAMEDEEAPQNTSTTTDAATAPDTKPAARSPHAQDNALQMLITALRQGTEMFSEQDQQRVVGGIRSSSR